jgi:hypothetical protein
MSDATRILPLEPKHAKPRSVIVLILLPYISLAFTCRLQVYVFKTPFNIIIIVAVKNPTIENPYGHARIPKPKYDLMRFIVVSIIPVFG